MATQLLMPKATAVWLVENTALTFEQIAKFCNLHLLEIKAIADGEAAQAIKGLDPIHNGQLSREEIDKGEADPNYQLKISEPKVQLPEQKKRRSHRYTPLSKRHDRPNAILWLVRNYPALKDSQISRLIGTTKGTIEQIRQRTHWNTANLTPIDPVTLGLCTQIDLDFEVARAAKNSPESEVPPSAAERQTLLPSTFTENLELAVEQHQKQQNKIQEESQNLEAGNIFSKLQALKTPSNEEN